MPPPPPLVAIVFDGSIRFSYFGRSFRDHFYQTKLKSVMTACFIAEEDFYSLCYRDKPRPL